MDREPSLWGERRPGPRRLLTLLATLACGHAGTAQAFAEQPTVEAPHAKPSLVVEHAALRVGGTTTLALTFEIEPGWHLYWNGLNDTGFAPEWTLDLPDGWSAGEAQWPVAHRHVAEGEILDHIYEDRLTILIPVRVPASASPGEYPVTAHADWLVCKDACVPEDAEVHAIVRIAPREDLAENRKPEFEAARAAMPRPAGELPEGLSWKAFGNTLVARVPGATALEFHPTIDAPELVDLWKTGRAEGNEITLTLAEARSAWIPPARYLRGTLVVERVEKRPDGTEATTRAGYLLGVPELDRGHGETNTPPETPEPGAPPSAPDARGE